jgi:ATP-binding cassette subfamily F protein 3
LAAGAVPDAREQRRLTAEARAQRAQQLRPLKREIEQIDQRLAALESERTALQAQLAGQPTPAQMADCGKRLKVGLDETQRLEERWLELSSELEGAAQGS